MSIITNSQNGVIKERNYQFIYDDKGRREIYLNHFEIDERLINYKIDALFKFRFANTYDFLFSAYEKQREIYKIETAKVARRDYEFDEIVREEFENLFKKQNEQKRRN